MVRDGFKKRPDGDALAPLLHWRVCWIWKWLYSEEQPYKVTQDIKAIYKADDIVDVRTGCIKCDIVTEDTAFKYLTRLPEWSYLSPLHELSNVYDYLRKAKNRHRLLTPGTRKDGTLQDNAGSLGAVTLKARLHALEWVLDIQKRANYTIIDSEEEARIRYLISVKTFPERWTGDEVTGDVMHEKVRVISGQIYTQPLLMAQDNLPKA